MQQGGRLRLRPWLEEQIQSGRYPGVSWLDQSARIFQIPWKHAARHGWNIDQDATLFRSWAMHTGSSDGTSVCHPNMRRISTADIRGRYRPGKDKPDPKTWKANFRCALNSLPDICELQEHSRKRGNNAFRVYRMMPSTQTHRRKRGLRLFSRPQQASATQSNGDNDAYSTHAWQPCTPRPAASAPRELETPAEDTFGNTQAHWMWDVKPEEEEPSETVFKLMDHFSSTDLWNQTGEQRGWRTHTLWDQWQCSGLDNPYSLHTDLLGPNYIRELSDWSTHQPTLMP